MSERIGFSNNKIIFSLFLSYHSFGYYENSTYFHQESIQDANNRLRFAHHSRLAYYTAIK